VGIEAAAIEVIHFFSSFFSSFFSVFFFFFFFEGGGSEVCGGRMGLRIAGKMFFRWFDFFLKKNGGREVKTPISYYRVLTNELHPPTDDSKRIFFFRWFEVRSRVESVGQQYATIGFKFKDLNQRA
jgi:hypothetical protein